MFLHHTTSSEDRPTRTAELQDIAALDRLAAQLAPPSALRRWFHQRRAAQEARPVRRGPVSAGRG